MPRVAREQLQLDLTQQHADPTEQKHPPHQDSCPEIDGSVGSQNSGRAHARCHSAAELLRTPGAVLTRSHLRDLGWERRGVDAIFRALPVVAVEGYSRAVIQVEDYLELMQRSTFRDDRVRPMSTASLTPTLSPVSDG